MVAAAAADGECHRSASARGVGAWPIQFETSPIDFKLYLTGIAIQYDAIDYPNNGGYRGYTSSGSETPVLAHHLLMFGLASAGQISDEFFTKEANSATPYTVDPEMSLAWQNLVRRNSLLPDRVGPLDLYLPTCPPASRLGKRPDPAPPPQVDAGQAPAEGETTGFFGAYKQTGGGGGGGGRCFVATAAYGSPYAREVELLREFRDGVLRRTRAGDAWFDRFYRRYSEWSPPIADLMEQDPELAELMASESSSRVWGGSSWP